MTQNNVDSLERFVRTLYKSQLTERPKSISERASKSELDEIGKKRQLGYVHYCAVRYENLGLGKIHKIQDKCKVARTYETVMKNFLAFDDYKGYHVNTWYTPNTFFTSMPYEKKVKGMKIGGRKESTVRWMNAFFIDIDSKEKGPDEILSCIENANLPKPNIINETTKGYHVYWIFSEAIFADQSTINLYKNIIGHLHKALGSIDKLDTKLKDICRWMQIPRAIVHEDYSHLPSFADFKRWYNSTVLDHSKRNTHNGICGRRAVVAYKHIGSSLDDAVNVILKGVKKGDRNSACFALACYYAHKGYAQKDVESFLIDWNGRNEDPDSHPISMVLKTVNSVFKSRRSSDEEGNVGMPYKLISELSGINVCGWVKHRRDRSVRLAQESKEGRSHYHEWIFDMVHYMSSKGIRTISGSQQEIADAMGVPLSTFKEILRMMREGLFGVFKLSVSGKGRYAVTTLLLNEVLARSFNLEQAETSVFVAMTGTDDSKGSMVQSAYSFISSCREGRVGTHKKGVSPPF